MANSARAIVVHVKAQSTLGSAVSITPGTDPALRVFSRPVPTLIGEGIIERDDGLSPVGPGLRGVFGSRGWEVTILTELLPFSDSADAASSPLAPLWNSCGVMTEDDVTWTPSRNAARGTAIGTLVPFTMTIDEIGGDKYTLFDCHAIPTITLEAGQRGMISWAVRGQYVAPVASTLAFGTAVYGADPLPVVTIGMTTADQASDYPTIARLEITTGLAFADRPATTAESGMAAPYLDWAEAPVAAFTCDVATSTSPEVYTKAFAQTAQALSFTLGDLEIAMPVGYLRVPTPSGDTFATYDLEVRGTPDSSDQSLLFTWS